VNTQRKRKAVQGCECDLCKHLRKVTAWAVFGWVFAAVVLFAVLGALAFIAEQTILAFRWALPW
jgi:hypothetical protein